MTATAPQVGVRVRPEWLAAALAALQQAGGEAHHGSADGPGLWLAEPRLLDAADAACGAPIVWLRPPSDEAPPGLAAGLTLTWPIQTEALAQVLSLAAWASPERRAVLDAVAAAVVVVDPVGTAITANRAWRELSGIAADAAVPWTATIHAADLATVQQAATLGDAARPGPARFRLLRPDGRTAWLELAGATLTRADGGRLGQLLTLTEVTECVSTRDELERVNALLTTTLDSAPTAVVVTTREGVVTAWNQAAESMFGWSAAEVLGHTVPYGEPGDGDLVALALAWLEAHSGSYHYEGRRRRRDGEVVEVSVRAAGIRDDQGRITALVATISDFTAQNVAARRLAESEERYRVVSLLSSDAAYCAAAQPDGSYAMEWATDGMSRLFGLAGGAMGYDAVMARIHPADSAMMAERYRKLLAGRDDICEYRVVLPDVGVRWLRSYSHAERDAAGRVVRIFGAVQDITERRRLGNEVDRNRRQLRQLAAQTVLAEERERRRIAIELHDRIGQSLTALKMRLARRADPRELLAETDRAVQSLMQDVRLLTNELSPPVLYDLGFAAAVEWLADRSLAQHGLDVTVGGEWPEPLAEELQILLYQGLRELLFNVVKHADATHADVVLSQAAGFASATVRDNGRGFTLRTDDLVERDCFGLFSLRERMEHVGGRLQVESQSGQGAAVSLIVPYQPA